MMPTSESAALAEVSHIQSMHDNITRSHIDGLVLLITRFLDNPEVQRAGCGAIDTLAGSGLLLRSPLAREYEPLVRNATSLNSIPRAILSAGGLHCILSAMSAHIGSVPVQEAAAGAIIALSSCGETLSGALEALRTARRVHRRVLIRTSRVHVAIDTLSPAPAPPQYLPAVPEWFPEDWNYAAYRQ